MSTRLFRLLALATTLLIAVLGARAADQHADGPLSLIITYRASPANRLALRHELEGPGARQFQQWQDSGVLSGYTLLFGRYADNDNLDASAVLRFANYGAVQRWKAIEQSAPGGLGPKALALTTAIQTTPVDEVRGKRATPASADSVYMVIPYEVLIGTPDYLQYADGYVLPQVDGWMQEGVLASYALYVDRYGAGRPWSAMLILEYKNDAALGAREAVVAKVRARLKEKPEWKAISDSKKTIRNERQLVIADPLLVAGAAH